MQIGAKSGTAQLGDTIGSFGAKPLLEQCPHPRWTMSFPGYAKRLTQRPMTCPREDTICQEFESLEVVDSTISLTRTTVTTAGDKILNPSSPTRGAVEKPTSNQRTVIHTTPSVDDGRPTVGMGQTLIVASMKALNISVRKDPALKCLFV